MLAPGKIIDVRYEIIKNVEEDHHGAVYFAYHKNLKKQIIIKEIKDLSSSPEERNKTPLLIEKIRTFAKFDHPSIVKILDFFNIEENFYIIMDYIKGQSLENIMKFRNSEPFEEKEIIKYSIQLCKVLWFLHNQRPVPVIMGNLNPKNIIFCNDENISLVSLGINRYINENPGEKKGFTAPEIYRKQISPLSDIFSLGNIIYYISTGLNPAISQNYDIPPLRSINPAISRTLEQIVKKSTELEPAARYLKMKEMKDALEACLRSSEKVLLKNESAQIGKSVDEDIFKSSTIITPEDFKKNLHQALEVCLKTGKAERENSVITTAVKDDEEPTYEINKNLDEDPFEKISIERARKTKELKEKQKAAYEKVEKSYKEKERAEKKKFFKFIAPVLTIIIILLTLIIYFITR